jgi:hypothetical protein
MTTTPPPMRRWTGWRTRRRAVRRPERFAVFGAVFLAVRVGRRVATAEAVAAPTGRTPVDAAPADEALASRGSERSALRRALRSCLPCLGGRGALPRPALFAGARSRSTARSNGAWMAAAGLSGPANPDRREPTSVVQASEAWLAPARRVSLAVARCERCRSGGGASLASAAGAPHSCRGHVDIVSSGRPLALSH